MKNQCPPDHGLVAKINIMTVMGISKKMLKSVRGVFWLLIFKQLSVCLYDSCSAKVILFSIEMSQKTKLVLFI